MSRYVALAVAFFLGPAAPGAWAATNTPVVTNPDWLEPPSAELLAEHYPKLASALEIEGSAQISCSVNERGRLSECRIDAEAPQGFGFGASALSMSSAFRMKPRTVDGRPVDGAIARIPIRFSLPPLPAMPSTDGIGPESRALALQIVDAHQLGKTNKIDLANLIRELEAGSPQGVSETYRSAAAKALRAAGVRQLEGIREQIVSGLISTYSEEELRAYAKFAASTSGSVARNNPALADYAARLPAELMSTVRAESRSAFCDLRPCRPSIDQMNQIEAVDRNVAIDRPIWTAFPAEAEVRVTTPVVANLLGLTGAARLTCVATTEGALANCKVATEAPAGLGFGAAALLLADSYRLAELRSESTVSLRVNFPAEVAPGSTGVPKGRSAQAIVLAHRVVAHEIPIKAAGAKWASTPLLVLKNSGGQIAPNTAEVVKTAVRLGVERALNRAADDLANIIAAEYTEEQIAGFSAFRESSIGLAIEAKKPALEAVMQLAARHGGSLIANDARAEFCADRDCDALQSTPKGALPPQPTAASPDPSTRKP